MRDDTLLWWDESMSTRLDDEATGAYVIIAQRSHHSDLCGHVIKKAADGEIDDLVTLILPARFEKERELSLQTRTPLDFADPRTKEGEPIDHNRFPELVLDKREKRMTAYSRAGQMQQRPGIRGGGMFPVEMFKIISRSPHPNQVLGAIRYWDKAGTEGGGSRTAGSLMLRLKSNNSLDIDYLVVDMVKGQWGAGKREMRIRQTAEIDSSREYNIKTWIEQEPGSGGKDSALSTVQNLAGFSIKVDKVGSSSGNKEARAEPYAAQVEYGRVGLLQGEWNTEFIDEHEKAPTGVFKDQWDSSAGAFNKLTIAGKKAGVWGR
jgi:predicted phage terminase large subunit-like protein